MLFLQIGEGVDDETWAFHLRRGDYSGWIRSAIKDDDLADEIQGLENSTLSGQTTAGSASGQTISARYTAP